MLACPTIGSSFEHSKEALTSFSLPSFSEVGSSKLKIAFEIVSTVPTAEFGLLLEFTR